MSLPGPRSGARSFPQQLRQRLRHRLRQREAATGSPVPRPIIALPEAADPRIQDAALRLSDEAILEPLLIGGPEGGVTDEELRRYASLLSSLPRKRPLSPADALEAVKDPLTRAALMMVCGEVDGVVAGAVHATADVVRAGLRFVGTRVGNSTLSSAFYMEVGDFRGSGPEVLTFTDAGVIPEPTVDQLVDIAREACVARRLVVGDEPRVAFLSYSTAGSAGGPSVGRMKDALGRFRELVPDVVADGELQADAALIPDVAERKCSGSPLEGSANVLVFPSLDAANIAYKLVQRLAGAVALGPILQGLRYPLNDLSRGASVSDVMDVAYVTALMACAKAP